jgi:5'-nucleotidase
MIFPIVSIFVTNSLISPAFALNILLVNDDGLSANIKALQVALQSAGHDVIVSIPCQNQSGKGAAVSFLTPLVPLTKACRNNAAQIGDPGAGAVRGMPNYYYVDGTPVMATLYGLDVLANNHWGKQPDLVISGPNEGQNTGSIVNSSGTVSNAQLSASRGVPAIAVSADLNTTDNDVLAEETANLTIKLLGALQEKAGTGAFLPEGVALNINYPQFSAGEAGNLRWAFSRFGTYNSFQMKFVSDLSQDPNAQSFGLSNSAYPGITIVMEDKKPSADQLQDEASVIASGKIAVTAMQVGFESRRFSQQWMQLRLNNLLSE